jgi:hypothetical protein
VSEVRFLLAGSVPVACAGTGMVAPAARAALPAATLAAWNMKRRRVGSTGAGWYYVNQLEPLATSGGLT